MVSMVRFVPLGMAILVFAAGLVTWRNRWRMNHGMDNVPVFPAACFYMYVVILLTITFFSRESGSGEGIDLALFSTWGINDRNNAYVIENVLLFVPYGFFGAWSYTKLRKFIPSLGLGLLTSLVIECLQLLTQRGFFQLDDILTNVLGSVLGLVIASVFMR